MSHDDSSDRAGSPLITQPSTGWVGWAVEQTESVLRAIPALLCNAPYPREPAQGGTRYAIIPPLHGRRKSRDRHPDPREVAVSDHNRQTSQITHISAQRPTAAQSAHEPGCPVVGPRWRKAPSAGTPRRHVPSTRCLRRSSVLPPW